MDVAFKMTKNMPAHSTMLHHPQTGAPTALTTDAKDTAVGAVLEQKTGTYWKLLAFFSRQLRAPERNYAAFDR